jgi:hypothetical protein
MGQRYYSKSNRTATAMQIAKLDSRNRFLESRPNKKKPSADHAEGVGEATYSYWNRFKALLASST